MSWSPVSKYPEEFRRDAVELVLSSPKRPLREVARELVVNHETLRGWVNAAAPARNAEAGRGRAEEPVCANEREELRRLRRRVAELELEKARRSSATSQVRGESHTAVQAMRAAAYAAWAQAENTTLRPHARAQPGSVPQHQSLIAPNRCPCRGHSTADTGMRGVCCLW